MPYSPIKGAIRRLREEEGITASQLAARTGISLRQILALESEKPPLTMQVKTHDAIYTALNCKKKGEAIALQVRTRHHARQVAKTEAVAPRREPPSPDEPTDGADDLPKMGTLSARAAIEREEKLNCQTLTAGDRSYDLLGLDRFKRCFSRPKAHEGKVFAVHGKIDDYMGISAPQARVLDADDGMKFRVVRHVCSGAPFYTTIYVRAKHADAITRDMDAKRAITVLVRVVHKSSATRADVRAFKGFHWIETDRIPRDFAFLVEEIITDPVKLLPTASRNARRNASDQGDSPPAKPDIRAATDGNAAVSAKARRTKRETIG